MCLLLAGAAGVGIWGWSHVRMAVSQMWANHELDHRIARQQPSTAPAPGVRPAPLANGALIGRLEIPRLKLRAVVREGAGRATLDVALGHIPGTALPGQPGNVAVAGHRDTLFRGLRHIEKDDVIQFQTPGGNYDYKVESTSIVKPSDVGVLRASAQPEMTLVTCYPFYYVGSAPDRFIVKARLVDAPSAPAPAPPKPAIADAQPPAAAKPAKPGMAAAIAKPAPHGTFVRSGARASRSQPAASAVRKVAFWVREGDSREVVPGIRVGLSRVDFAGRQASLWMFVTPERYSISLRNQPVRHAVFFHGHDDGKQRELMITEVNPASVSGYVVQYGSGRPSGARSGRVH
ncbi:MAG: class D sortase [Bryobacteraceae bacterium]